MDPSGLVDQAEKVIKARDAIAAAETVKQIIAAMNVFDQMYGEFARCAARASLIAQADALRRITGAPGAAYVTR